MEVIPEKEDIRIRIMVRIRVTSSPDPNCNSDPNPNPDPNPRSQVYLLATTKGLPWTMFCAICLWNGDRTLHRAAPKKFVAALLQIVAKSKSWLNFI